jgi:hypothetical protein
VKKVVSCIHQHLATTASITLTHIQMLCIQLLIDMGEGGPGLYPAVLTSANGCMHVCVPAQQVFPLLSHSPRASL